MGGKTSEEFREAWYHHVGFGTSNWMFTFLNVANPREVVVIGLTEVDLEDAADMIGIDERERPERPLDHVVEPEFERIFGVLVSEDDFSAVGEVEFKPATVNGELTDMDAVHAALQFGADLLAGHLPPSARYQRSSNRSAAVQPP